MDTNIQIFKNNQFGEVRVAEVNGEPLFCLSDVCKVLDIANASNVKNRLNKKGVHNMDTLTNGGLQSMIYINEGNLYKATLQSRKPEAEVFQDWLCYEVAPSIRKSGGYMLTSQEDTPEMIMARALLVAQSTIERHKEQYQLAKATIMEQAPKVEYFNEVLQSEALIPVNVIAKELGMTAISLNNRLHHKGIIYKSGSTWVLYEKYQDKGYTRTKTITYIDSLGNNKTAIHTYWTESGRLFIHRLLKGEKAA